MASVDELHNRAWQHYRANERDEVERLCWETLRMQPLHAGSIYLLGVLALDANRTLPALLHFHHVTVLQPDIADYQHALGEAYRALGSSKEAATALLTAIKLNPNHAAAHNSLGQVLLDQGTSGEAIGYFRKALTLRPDYERAHNNLGRALKAAGDLEGAVACFEAAIKIQPDYAVALSNHGAVLQALGRLDEAERSMRKALAAQPAYAEGHFNLGTLLYARGESAAAANCFRDALRLRPEYVKAYNNLGLALSDLDQPEPARAAFEAALRLQPDFIESQLNLGSLLVRLLHYEAALPVLENAVRLQPDNRLAFANLVKCRQLLCDWRHRAADHQRIEADTARALAAGEAAGVQPFDALSLNWPPQRQLALARGYARTLLQRLGPQTPFAHPRSHSGRLRLGYLSADFHGHATMHLMGALFGLHDRSAFEVLAYSYGPDDGSDYRRRAIQDCDKFHDIASLSILESARRIHADGVHILIDLKGYTGQSRPAIMALRPAPIQVSYLGFPGTSGADFMDYLIADTVVTPPDADADFSERLVRLPHSYQVNDHRQAIADTPVTRRDQGLPETGFIYCCFNQCFKIEPAVFAVWMNLLRQTPGSVLWLLHSTATAERNLRREAEASGVPGQRLVFAPHIRKSDHLRRVQLSGLFLDTPYYNAHTTASDALWAGVPVVTCAGHCFADRVAASLLTAVGLPELIVADVGSYEQLALRLAHQPEELRRLRDKLAAQRTTWPLFDTPRFVRNLERAYWTMWDIYASGEPTRAIMVSEDKA